LPFLPVGPFAVQVRVMSLATGCAPLLLTMPAFDFSARQPITNGIEYRLAAWVRTTVRAASHPPVPDAEPQEGNDHQLRSGTPAHDSQQKGPENHRRRDGGNNAGQDAQPPWERAGVWAPRERW
jgi:hypothetical protein